MRASSPVLAWIFAVAAVLLFVASITGDGGGLGGSGVFADAGWSYGLVVAVLATFLLRAIAVGRPADAAASPVLHAATWGLAASILAVAVAGAFGAWLAGLPQATAVVRIGSALAVVACIAVLVGASKLLRRAD
ncbi:MAG TPA: hypothetical protein VI997_10470 [Candidatus Thermoplasmatota archaeon]|nr:hypothetical protein [Candidatus Thermoplasmatota archaeon]